MKRLLLVDDEPQLLQILKEHFEGQYEIDTATSGAAAIERFVRQRPVVVFLDVNLKQGAFSYVPKPFNMTYMDHMAAAAADQRRERRP